MGSNPIVSATKKAGPSSGPAFLVADDVDKNPSVRNEGHRPEFGGAKRSQSHRLAAVPYQALLKSAPKGGLRITEQVRRPSIYAIDKLSP